jgi:hypothetical protein
MRSAGAEEKEAVTANGQTQLRRDTGKSCDVRTIDSSTISIGVVVISLFSPHSLIVFA